MPISAGTRPHGIFNRSYYEEVQIVRVHPEILRSRALAGELFDK
jgi:polyphosphate kinase 2 (PPK2 family)